MEACFSLRNPSVREQRMLVDPIFTGSYPEIIMPHAQQFLENRCIYDYSSTIALKD